MDPHQQQQQNRRRTVDAGGGSGQAHPPPQPCPRCNSNNTKFCYYNNYSLSQPRYFCKGCRRYWTQGGTLRNVPVGGGCRKSKRPKLEGSTGVSSHSQSSQLPLSLPVPPPSQLPHQQLISIMANNNNNNDNMSTSNNNSSNNNNNIGYFGETPGLFLSSLGVNRPMSFGPNLGLLHGFGLPNFDHQQPLQQPQQQHNQDVSLPSLYSTRELGSSSTSSIQEWNLRMGPGPGPNTGLGPGPVVPQVNVNANINDNDNNHDHNHDHDQERNDNIRSSNEPWSNFLGTSGLDDP